MAPTNTDRNRETILKIETKYNIKMPSEVADKMRKEKQDLNKKITIPKPFSFVDKKRENKTIMQTKFEKTLEEKELEIKKFENWQFKSNPVPAECLIPLMNTLDAKRDERINRYKEMRESQKIREFSFIKRDMQRAESLERLREKWQPKDHLFKAKPIPPTVSYPL